MSKGKRRLTIFFSLLVLGVAGGGIYGKSELAPMPRGEKFYVRWEKGTRIGDALSALEKKGVVRNAFVSKWYARVQRAPGLLESGTYQFAPGMTIEQVLASLEKPIKQKVRIPEDYLSYRVAALLQKSEVCEAKDYKVAMGEPGRFKRVVDFILPKDSLEGYLYPDTYELPPLLGANRTIQKQLEAFQSKAYPLLKGRRDIQRVLTIASMVELEAAAESERPIVAGVIENRLARKMPLQIDATVLYALGEWRRLTFADYKSVNSPYNTYLQPGLPPGPICSPSLRSIQAALHPAAHSYLYYVAMPDHHHLFASTYPEHLHNIALAKAARKLEGP